MVGVEEKVLHPNDILVLLKPEVPVKVYVVSTFWDDFLCAYGSCAGY